MKRKMILLIGIMVLGIGLVGEPVKAATYTVDTLLGAIESSQSGQAYEEAQLEALCGVGCNVTLLTNVDIGTFNTTVDSQNYIDVAPNEPGYFILKFGTGNTGNDMFFFQNIGELSKLVWTDGQLTAAGLPANHIQSISHYAITSSGKVPEPASLMLLGAGLAGIGIWRRKFAKS